MVTCGHQLDSGDDDGWLLCSSAAAPVGGNHESHLILHRIMKELKLSNKVDFFQSHRITLSVAKEREIKLMKHREDRLTRKHKSDLFHDFSNFDETEHFDGCPVKWLFRRQSTESWRSCSFKPTEEKTVRDKIPKEIQIRKIGLKKRKNFKERNLDQIEGRDVREIAARDDHRAKLAAKLNFRPFYENDDDISDSESTGYLFAKELCVLLAPRVSNTSSKVSKTKERDTSPSMSVRSLVLPEIAKPRPKTTPMSSSAQRWSGKQQKAPENNRNRRYDSKKGSIQVISSRVKFSQRPGKPMR